jgi:hypothetical protein
MKIDSYHGPKSNSIFFIGQQSGNFQIISALRLALNSTKTYYFYRKHLTNFAIFKI